MSPRAVVAVLSLSLTAVPIAAAVDLERAAPVLRLAWIDPTDIATGSELVARAEAAALLTRMGVTVSWRRGSPGELMQRDEVVVILAGESPQSALGPLVLGATSRRRAVSPAVWIRVPNVRRAVGVRLGPSFFALGPLERRMVAVAIGRVIAHEVVHAVVPGQAHGSGLMAATLTKRQLCAASLSVEPEVAFALQAALRGDPVFTPAESSVLAARAEAQEKDR